MADEQQDPRAGGGGLRMADRRLRFEKHAIFGKNEAMKKAFTRPWGSQPMKVNLKTGALAGTPHPEPKLVREKEKEPAAQQAEVPTKDTKMQQAYGR